MSAPLFFGLTLVIHSFILCSRREIRAMQTRSYHPYKTPSMAATIRLPGITFTNKDRVKNGLRKFDSLTWNPKKGTTKGYWSCTPQVFQRNRLLLEKYLKEEVVGPVSVSGKWLSNVSPVGYHDATHSIYRHQYHPLFAWEYRDIYLLTDGDSVCGQVGPFTILSRCKIPLHTHVTIQQVPIWNGKTVVSMYAVSEITDKSSISPSDRYGIEGMNMDDPDITIRQVEQWVNSYQTTFERSETLWECQSDNVPIDDVNLSPLTIDSFMADPILLLQLGAEVRLVIRMMNDLNVSGEQRIQMNLLLSFERQFLNGHTKLTWDQIRLGIPETSQWIDWQCTIKQITSTWRIDDSHFQLPVYGQLEQSLADMWREYQSSVTTWLHIDYSQVWVNLRHDDRTRDASLSESQWTALHRLIGQPETSITLLNAPAGTGKTFLIDRITRATVNATRSDGTPCQVLLVAVSNKAVLRMSQDFHDLVQRTVDRTDRTGDHGTTSSPSSPSSQSTPVRSWMARTISSLLVTPPTDTFQPDLVIVDESSMIGLRMMVRLLRHMHRYTMLPRLIFVGDPRQLPPIHDAGDPFAFLCRRWGAAELTEIRRSTDETFCQLLRQMQTSSSPSMDLVDLASESESFAICTRTKHPETILEQLTPQWKDELERGNLIVICPYKPKQQPTPNLPWEWMTFLRNRLIGEEEKQSSSSLCTLGRQGLTRLDRIIGMKNDLSMGLANGRMGQVIYVGMEPSGSDIYHSCGPSGPLSSMAGGASSSTTDDMCYLCIRWDQPEETIGYRIRKEMVHLYFQLSYVTTIHKMQGSEADYILCLFDGVYSLQLNHAMLYTAVSRTKKKMLFVGNSHTWRTAWTTHDHRQTHLESVFNVR